MGCQIARLQTFVRECILNDVKILRTEKNELHDFVSSHPDLDDSSLDVSRTVPFCDVHLRPWMLRSMAILQLWRDLMKFELQVRGARIMDCKKPPTHCNRCRKAFTMRTWSNAAMAFSEDMPAIDLASGQK